MNLFRVLVAVPLAATLTAAQAPVETRFEVASVRPNTSGSRSSGTRRLPSGQFLATNVTVRALIVRAYEVRNYQVTGGPDWIDAERFDINARAEHADADFAAMLRALLAERFNLLIHRETREQPVYALVRARPAGALGPGIKPSVLVCSGPDAPKPQADQPSLCGLNTSVNSRTGRIVGGALTSDAIAAAIANYDSSRMVVDRSGLEGTFDFELEWAVDGAQPAVGRNGTELPSLFTAIQEQLGLKLQSDRGPVEFVVIDRVEPLIPD